MLELLRQRRERDEDGFTLIELMVVVLIIAILIAIAIPTFLGAQNRARDRAAQSDLRNALTAAKTLATDQEGYFKNAAGTAITPSDMKSTEGALSFTGTFPTGSITDVYVTTETDGYGIGLVRKSASGTFFGLVATQDGSVGYCKGTGLGSGDVTPVAGSAALPGTCNAAKW